MTRVRIDGGVRAATTLALLAMLQAAPAASQATTFFACYIPSVGAIYLIKLAGLPQACLSTSHQQISWTEGGPPPDGSVTTAKLADGAYKLAFPPQKKDASLAVSLGDVRKTIQLQPRTRPELSELAVQFVAAATREWLAPLSIELRVRELGR